MGCSGLKVRHVDKLEVNRDKKLFINWGGEESATFNLDLSMLAFADDTTIFVHEDAETFESVSDREGEGETADESKEKMNKYSGTEVSSGVP
jgi:hypothetical protein